MADRTSVEGEVADNPIVTSFGNAGTRTARVNTGSVTLKGDELLVYSVTVKGANPAFGFACRHLALHSAEDFEGHPRAKYEWDYSPDRDRDRLMLLLSFVGAVRYTVRIDHISQAGALLKTVRDVDYESQDPEDTAEDNLSVFHRA
jgi:hypothetical protein